MYQGFASMAESSATTFDLLQGAVDHLYFSDLIYVPENRAERGLFNIFTERFVATEKSVSHSWVSKGRLLYNVEFHTGRVQGSVPALTAKKSSKQC